MQKAGVYSVKVKKIKSLYKLSVHPADADVNFLSMKPLGLFLLLPEWERETPKW